MFDIEYKGANAVIFTTKKTRVVFDPRLSLLGGKDIAINGDVEVTTEERFVVENATPKIVFHGPGEYEVGDVAILGIPAKRHIDTDADGLQSTIYRVQVGDVKTVVIGNVAPKLSDEQLETLGMVDMVVIPVGGNGYTLDATDAATMVRQIGPRAVIPVHYADDSLRYEVPQEDIERFVKELGVGVIEAGTKQKIKNDSSIPDQLTVIKIAKS